MEIAAGSSADQSPRFAVNFLVRELPCKVLYSLQLGDRRTLLVGLLKALHHFQIITLEKGDLGSSKAAHFRVLLETKLSQT